MIIIGFGYSSFLLLSKLKRPSLKIIDHQAKIKTSFKVEIADNQEERSKGLMFRKDLPLNEGMIFVFPKEEEHFFWMKNTLIPLDIIFIDRDGEIVGLIENASPGEEKLLTVGRDSLYVLEINAGLVKKYDINIKDKIKGLKFL